MKLRRWFLADNEKLVAVKSWFPRIDWDSNRRRVEILGPLLLTERGGTRSSGRFIWDWNHLKAPWMK